ncbi:potassium channel family protein [Pseudophaeobacter sp.]|uniref:potassium channel family protein n=1 Tax=Pseudophaeobacter sp. TaxID=1971739 RepID=UPI0026364C33|nr:potassium channel family protein [Pseudophaeobacter sp.]
MSQLRRMTIFVSLLVIISGSTVFFRIVEGWSWLDSYFFTIVTISTVGYGNLVPITAAGKLATTFLIFGGLGVFALAIHEFAKIQLLKRQEHNEWLFARLGRHKEGEEDLVANKDDQPHRPSQSQSAPHQGGLPSSPQDPSGQK